jgi:hypothetical protein
VRRRTSSARAGCDDGTVEEAPMLIRLTVVFTVAFAVLAPVAFA